MANILDAVVTEMKVQQIINEQEITGVNLDLNKCKQNIEDLITIKGDLYKKVRPNLKLEVVPLESKVPADMIWKERDYVIHKGERNFVKKKFNKNGERVAVVDKYCTNSGLCFDSIHGPFSRLDFEEPALSRRQKLCEQLLRLGWKPEFRTEKGAPKLTHKGVPAPSLEKIGGEIGKDLSRWFIASHRQSQIEGWVRDARPDGRITARCNPCSTNTTRAKMSVVVNVPKAIDSVFFGKEMRSCFISTEGYSLCGYDASSLEARCSAHYTLPIDDGEFAKEILEGDIHQKNADYFNIERNQAKSLYFGLIYGASPGKIKELLHCSAKVSKEIFNEFWSVNYALGKVREKCMRAHNNKGYLPGLDGRKLFTRSEHSAMNVLFQGAGATIMANTMVNHIDKIREAKWKSKPIQVVYYTDEFIFDRVLEEDKEQLTTICKDSIALAGKQLAFRVPLLSDVQFGNSWADIH